MNSLTEAGGIRVGDKVELKPQYTALDGREWRGVVAAIRPPTVVTCLPIYEECIPCDEPIAEVWQSAESYRGFPVSWLSPILERRRLF